MVQQGDGGTARAGKDQLARMVTPALEAELKKLPEDAQNSALAATALSLAKVIDGGETSAGAKAALYKVYIELLDRLRALAPDEQQEDKLDELRKRRSSRRSAA